MTDKSNFIREQLLESAAVKTATIEACTPVLLEAAGMIEGTLHNRGKLLLCGNGGSAADAQHLAAELVIRLSHDVNRPGIPALALTTDTSVLTAGGNDIGFSNVFARQVEALGHPEDILLAISTSGNSENIVKAIETAKSRKVRTIGFLGGSGGRCAELVDLAVIVPSQNTQRIQETHITLGHILLEMVERTMYGNQ
jgi:D-sedoheptulose 7-phosphate isomerase